MKSPYLAESHREAELEQNEDYAALKCPECGDTMLHHVQAEACWRDYEDGPGTVTHSQNGMVNSARVDEEYIPGRRDCLHLTFYCETCHPPPSDETFTLRIEQHKGETRLYWVKP